MPFIDHDSDAVRKYLLGQLSEDQQQNFVQRLLAEDELTQELEVTTEELVDEHLAGQLTPEESEWFEQHFLASPQGQKSRRLAKTLQRYFSNKEPVKRSWTERLPAFWNRQAAQLRIAAALAVVVLVVGVVWFSRTPSPQSFATLTLTSSPLTRSSGGELARIRFKEDALRINLMLESPATPGTRYRAELIDGKGEVRTLEPISRDAQSVALEIPGSWLSRGQYAIKLSTITADNTAQRLPGNYQFLVE